MVSLWTHLYTNLHYGNNLYFHLLCTAVCARFDSCCQHGSRMCEDGLWNHIFKVEPKGHICQRDDLSLKLWHKMWEATCIFLRIVRSFICVFSLQVGLSLQLQNGKQAQWLNKMCKINIEPSKRNKETSDLFCMNPKLFFFYHSRLQLILRVCKSTVSSSRTASLLTKISAHAGLVLAVGLRLNDTQTRLRGTKQSWTLRHKTTLQGCRLIFFPTAGETSCAHLLTPHQNIQHILLLSRRSFLNGFFIDSCSVFAWIWSIQAIWLDLFEKTVPEKQLSCPRFRAKQAGKNKHLFIK